MRLYVKPNTKAYDVAVEVFRVYGISPALQKDDRGSYFDVTPPDYWTKYRKEKFKSALEKMHWL